MSYRLIRNAAVKSCTAKIFGIGCFAKNLLLPLSEFCKATSIYIFHNISKQKGGESILIIIDLKQNWSWNIHSIRLLALANVKMFALAAIGMNNTGAGVAPPQTVTNSQREENA